MPDFLYLCTMAKKIIQRTRPVWITKEQQAQIVMRNAHSRFSSERNALSWKECLRASWDVMHLLMRSGYYRIMHTYVEGSFKLELPYSKNSVDYGDIPPEVLGYGIGHYCGD